MPDILLHGVVFLKLLISSNFVNYYLIPCTVDLIFYFDDRSQELFRCIVLF